MRAKRRESLLAHTTLPVPESQKRSLTTSPGLFDSGLLAEVVSQVHSSSLRRGRSTPASSSSPLTGPRLPSFTRGRPYGKRSSSSSRTGGRKRFRGGKGGGSFFRTFGFPELGAISFPDPFRRLSVPPLAGLEGRVRSLWVVEVLRVDYCLPFLSTPPPLQCSHSIAFLQPHLHQGGCSGGGHLRLNCQGCCGACSTRFSGLLQPSVRSVEDLGVMASGHRPLSSQSLCGRVSLPDGDHSVCAPVGTSGGLDGLHRSQGSVSSSAGSSCFSSLSSLHVSSLRVSGVRSHLLSGPFPAVVCPSIGRPGGTGAEPWVVEVLRVGYCLPFLSTPPLSNVPIPLPSYSPTSIKGAALEEVTLGLIAKGAVELAPLASPGFYSCLFVVWKTSGSWRPVIDLSHLNLFVDVSHFQMETIQSVLLSVRQGDWMASIDLKEAYLQVLVHPASRHFLRFMFRDTVYQFKALCFGLSTAPQVFTRVMAPVSAILHSMGIRMRRYLDDWLVQSSSRESLLEELQTVLQLCHELGIVVNPQKSNLVPSQVVQYLGVVIDSTSFEASPSVERISRLQSTAAEFQSCASPTASLWLSLLGVLSSLAHLVPGGRRGCGPSSSASIDLGIVRIWGLQCMCQWSVFATSSGGSISLVSL